MRRMTRATFAFGAVLASVPAAAQAPAIPPNPRVEIAYVEPVNPAHRPIYDRLKKRRVLEELRSFLAPLRVPADRKLSVKIEGCEGKSEGGYANGVVTICYEYVEGVRRLAPPGETPEGWKATDAIVGPFIDVVFRGVAAAVFDIYDVPIWGREKDAADFLSAFIMWQFGEDVARKTLTGLAHYYRAKAAAAGDPTREELASEYGTPWQRFFNTLCILYGRDPWAFRQLVQQGLLPKSRADRCNREFYQVADAFRHDILPHVDPELLRQVQARDWGPLLEAEGGQ